MQYNMKLFLVFLLCFSPLFSDEDIVVHLSTETRLEPLFFSPFNVKNSSLSPSYLDRLRKIFVFDFNYNGWSQLIKDSKAKARYILDVDINGNELSAKLSGTLSSGVKKAGPITITENLESDRRKIHQIADALYKSMTGEQGVATTKLLYTITLPNTDPTYKSKQMAEIWECDWDGGNQRQVTHDKRFAVTPCYLPPKHGYTPGTFFYVSYQIGQPKIQIGSLKDGSSERFSTLRGQQLMPAVNRQRDLVAFVSDIQGNPDIFVQPYDPQSGGVDAPRQVYATVNGTQGSPTFSPNGKQIAFVSNKDGNPRIYTMNIPSEGTLVKDMKPKLISKHCKESTSPSWSPDGTKLAYSAMCEGIRQIWIYDFATKEETQLTYGSLHKENPTFAPDSLHIAFNTNADGNSGCELYIVNLNQNEVVKVSSGPGEKRFPNWEPR